MEPQKWKSALQHINQTAWDTITVGEDPHLEGAVCTTGEDAVTGSRLHLHDTRTDVAEDGLFSMLSAERVHQPVAGQFPHLEKAEKTKMARAVSVFSPFHTPACSIFFSATSVPLKRINLQLAFIYKLMCDPFAIYGQQLLYWDVRTFSFKSLQPSEGSRAGVLTNLQPLMKAWWPHVLYLNGLRPTLLIFVQLTKCVMMGWHPNCWIQCEH